MWTELENLKESNEFLNLLLDNINSAVLIADEDLKIHQFNDSFLDLFDKATESVQKIVETVYATVKEFGQQAKPDDDISILGVEYCG